MREPDPTNARHLRRRLGCRTSNPASTKAAILATARYLLAPEDTTVEAGPVMSPAPHSRCSLATEALKTIFWMVAAVGLGLGIALLD